MENIPVTAYSGFSNVRGEITLRKVIENITTGIHAKSVSKIRLLVGQGKMEEANNVKKQLPFYTVTAGYREKRQAYSVIRYTHITLLDIDDQPEEKLEELRGKINGDPDTLASFLTPKGHGFKVFVFLKTDYATRLRATLAAKEKVGFSTLEKHHLAMYNACKEYYEKLLGVEVDGSGKDISRGFFTSFDEKAYMNEGLLKEVDETLTNIIPPEKPQPGRRKVISGKVVSDKPENEGKPKSGNKSEGKKAEAGKPEAEPWEKMEFNKAVLSVKRISKFEPGNRDSFMFALGNKCYAKGLEEETVIRLAQEKLGSEEFDVAAPIRNAYIYTDKTYEALGRKQEKPDTINQVLDFLKTHYDFRRNVILDRLEYRNFNEKEERWKGRFRPMRTRSYNAIFLDLQLAGIKCFRNYLQTVIDSSYPRDFNPFTEYIGKLKPWDGVTDYIGRLADTVQAEDQEFWRKSFRRWFVGIAGRHREPPGNHTLLRTGKGKEHMDKKAVAARVEGILPERNGQPRKQGPPAAAQHPPHHQHGRVRRGKGRRPGGAEEGNHTGERHGTESVRRTGVHLHTARIFHCQHQQPPMPAGHRGKQTVPALIHHFTGLQDARQLRGSIRAGACPAEAGVPILVRRRRDRRTEPPQRAAQNEGSGGGKPARILPEAGARRDLREMDARSHHTQQDSHLRKDTGEQADDTDTGDVA